MSSDRWHRIDQLFHSALECTSDERGPLLATACADDQELRAEVEALLTAHAKAGGVIDSPAFAEGLLILHEGQADPVPGGRIGSYKIVHELGRGGMGTVYLATRDDEQYQKQAAIKLIKRGMDADFVIQRFRTERQILANLEHPNIARLIDGGATHDGQPYLVMEYVEGQPISSYCDRGQLSLTQRLNLFLTVCAAVQFAHQNLVVHRDIKPGNILVTPDGVPKLLDFGIAKLVDPTRADLGEQTATHLRVMTPEYASPEQVRGQTITTASDVYSLGVLLYELLTGCRPYRITSKTPAEIERVICEVEPEKPSHAVIDQSSVASDAKAGAESTSDKGSSAHPEFLIHNRRSLRGDLDNIVLMAMRKEPKRRYVSVAQFADDIRRHLDGLPIIAHKDTVSYRSAKFIKRHKVAVAAATLIALTIIGGALGVFWQARIARRQARIAAQERDHARVEAAKAERTNEFLQDTLGFASQNWIAGPNGKGPEATIGEALEQASEHAESELADQPAVLAGVLSTIGTAYLNQAKFDLAEKYMRRALELERKVDGDDSPQTARAMDDLGSVLTLKGDYGGAQTLFQDALTIYHKHFAEGSVRPVWLVATLSNLGLVKVAAGKPAEAETLLREALNLAPQITGKERLNVALAFAHLAQARVSQGDLEEGETLYRSALEEYRKLPGAERPEMADALSSLGELLRTKGKYAESESMLRAALEVAGRLNGENSPRVAIALTYLAQLLYLKGDYAAAEEATNRSLALCRQLLPAGHPAYAGPMTTLGLIMNRTGRSIQAESTLRQALAIRERVLPKGHWQIAATQGALGECLTSQKRYAEAEPLLIQSYDAVKQTQGEQNPRTLEARERLAVLYEAWGKPTGTVRYRQ
jgi:serine/threonine-protein kinase